VLEKKPIRSFVDLHVWQEAHKLALMTYAAVSTFPSTQQFGLTSQIQRAVVSVTSNIAEGFGRYSIGERKQFYTQARGSLAEVQSQLLLAKDTKMLPESSFKAIYSQSEIVYRMINALLQSNRTNTPNSSTGGTE
jgi:four helix bundle protein